MVRGRICCIAVALLFATCGVAAVAENIVDTFDSSAGWTTTTSGSITAVFGDPDGYAGNCLEIEATGAPSTATTVKTFAVTPGETYICGLLVFGEPRLASGNPLNPGAMCGTTGSMRWGVDPTGQTADPDADTIIWFGYIGSKDPDVAYTTSSLTKYVYSEKEFRGYWRHQAFPVKMTGSTVSVWIEVDVTSTSRLPLTRWDNLSLTQVTLDSPNLIYNGDFEERNWYDPNVPLGWYDGSYKNGGTAPRTDYIGDRAHDTTNSGWGLVNYWERCAAPWYNISEAGRFVISGENLARLASYVVHVNQQAGFQTIVTGLPENTDFLFRVKVHEGNMGVYNNIGALAETAIRAHNEPSPVSTNAELCKYLLKVRWDDTPGFDARYGTWNYTWQGRGYYTLETVLSTADKRSGVNDECLNIELFMHSSWALDTWTWEDAVLVPVSDVVYDSNGYPIEYNADVIHISDIADSGAVAPDGTCTITWTTDKPAYSRVEYGTSEYSLPNVQEQTAALVTNHSIQLTGLDPSQDLYYRVVSFAPGLVTETSVQQRVLAPHATLVNAGFEGSWSSYQLENLVTTGQNGYMDTAYPSNPLDTNDDQFELWVDQGYGMAPGISVLAGMNGAMDSTEGGDDFAYPTNDPGTNPPLAISTGYDWVCDTAASGDDIQLLPVGNGVPYQAPCLLPGENMTYDADTVIDPDDVLADGLYGFLPEGWEKWGYSRGDLPDDILVGDPPMPCALDADGMMWTFPMYGFAHSGDYSLGMRNQVGQNGEVNGVLQVLQVQPGKTYEVSVWIAGVNWYNEDMTDPEFAQDQLISRIGVDPLGGGDPTADSVVWNDPYYYGIDTEDPNYPNHRINGKWYNETITVTAQSDRLTIILSAINRIGMVTDLIPSEEAHNFVFFDDVAIAEVPSGVEWTSPEYAVGFNMVSVPIVPEDGDMEASSVYDDIIAAGNVLTNALYKYAGGYLLYPGGFTEVEIGVGYWLKITTPASETIVGNELSEDNIEIPLVSGWQMIGHPRVNDVQLVDLMVTDGVTTLSWTDAVSPTYGWLQGVLYTYIPGVGYKAVQAGTADDSLEAGYGYWLKAYVSGLTLIVPPAP